MGNFCILILTHARPEKVYTVETLRRQGYTGPIFLVLDDEDITQDRYRELHGDRVVVFSKSRWAAITDAGDNFAPRGVVYARNASFEVAEKLGFRYFMQLDDDYTSFDFRFDSGLKYNEHKIKNIDSIIPHLINFFEESKCLTIALAQNGDFIGGQNGRYAEKITLFRKAMNSFLCSTERPFLFTGRINEDVNAYAGLGRRGSLFFTLNMLSLAQKATQQNSGGLTELYLDLGTYVKSFYTVMYQPSCCVVSDFGVTDKRLHHRLDWDRITPKILRKGV